MSRKTIAGALAIVLALGAAAALDTVTVMAADKTPISVIAAQYGPNTTQWWADFQDSFNKANPDIDLTVEVVS